VLRSIGRGLAIFALCCAIGLHWLALQSVAWTTMLIENSKRAPLLQAITETLDGAHPCSLCHAVNTGTQSQRRNEAQAMTPKVDLICSVRTINLIAEFAPFHFPLRSFSFSEHAESPPVPPPRELVA
jgi:hypothetical protein